MQQAKTVHCCQRKIHRSLNEFSTAQDRSCQVRCLDQGAIQFAEEIKGMQPSFLTLSTKKLIDAFC